MSTRWPQHSLRMASGDTWRNLSRPRCHSPQLAGCGPLAPGSAGRGLQALVSGLQRLGAERIIDESSREPAGSLPRHQRLSDGAAPNAWAARSMGSPASGLTFDFGASGMTVPAAPAPRLLMWSYPHNGFAACLDGD